MKTIQEKYENDVWFAKMVDTMYCYLRMNFLTPNDLLEACQLAVQEEIRISTTETEPKEGNKS